MTPSSDATPPIPQPDGTQPDPTTDPPVAPQDARRRRLLKGLIGVGTAVPLIFTLQRSGRAAFFGSNQACMNDLTDATAQGDACQAAADDKVRVNRSQFFDNGTSCLRSSMAGGTSAGTDQCLVYYHPDNGWFDYANSCGDGTYGKTSGYKVMTYSCWTSLHNTPGSTTGITGYPS